MKVIDEMGQRNHRDSTVFYGSFARLFAYFTPGAGYGGRIRHHQRLVLE